MARIPLEDLIDLAKASPKYFRNWEGSAPADVAFGIAVVSGVDTVRTETFETKNGRVLIVDFDAGGKVTGIEFH